MAFIKCIKLCCSESPASAAKSQELRHDDTNALQLWESSAVSLLCLWLKRKLALYHTLWLGLLVYHPHVSFSASSSLLHIQTAAHWPENSHIPVWALARFFAPLFPLVSLKAPTFWLGASLHHHSSQQLVAFTAVHNVCFIVGEEENLEGKNKSCFGLHKETWTN